VRVGVSLSLSGAFRLQGEQALSGLRLWTDYVADEGGRFDWAEPDEEVHAFVNDLARPVGTHLYGRRMYEVLVAWETIDDQTPYVRDFAEIWRAADKVV